MAMAAWNCSRVRAKPISQNCSSMRGRAVPATRSATGSPSSSATTGPWAERRMVSGSASTVPSSRSTLSAWRSTANGCVLPSSS